MSNTDDLAEQKTIEQEENLPTTPLAIKPMHRQFSKALIALFLTVTVALTLIFALFYQQYERSRSLIEGELTPLKQQFEQLQTLKKAESLIHELLFTDSGVNFVELRNALVTVNKQLLELESSNAYLYQQWLNANKSASDIALRIQQSHGRGEELKQSSIIQLQLMWFSVTPIINTKAAQQRLLFKQLQADNLNDRLTSSRANAYVSTIQQLDNLQELKRLLAEILTRFEQLTIHTSMDDFNLLRAGVEQIIAQGKTIKNQGKTKSIVEFSQQIDTFESIVLTQQRALAKWQGYIHLAQSYQLDLTMQNNQLLKILAEPQKTIAVKAPGTFNDLINKINIKFKTKITQEMLSIALLLAIGLSLSIFCYLLWRIRKQIKNTAQQSVLLIRESMGSENFGSVQANCAETQEIMLKVKTIAKPIHNEQEFQQLFQQCKTHQQTIDEQALALDEQTEKINQQRLENSEQVALDLQGELQRYKYLENVVLLFLQQQHVSLFNKPINTEKNEVAKSSSLFLVYKQLKEFRLVSYLQSENAVLSLIDINLVDEIQALLMNKQAMQIKLNNQLYFSYDDQLLVQTKLDFRLFQQLIDTLIDIVLQECQNAQLHLHLQLQDKNEGQQLVRFSVKVNTENLEALPDLVTLLIDSQMAKIPKSPLLELFNTLFVRQHGENINAHLIENGFQLNIELPMAIVSSSMLKEQQENILDGTQVRLLSSNEMLTELVEKFIHSASGNFAKLDYINDFEQQLTEKHLNKHKIDLLIVASDVAQTKVDSITQQLKGMPISLQPKLMILQSAALNSNDFGFYSQTEQLLFKEAFLQNVQELLIGDAHTNLLFSPEQCQQSHYLESALPVILAVHSPQKYQNLQRLLHWLGLQVHVVSHADAQRELWKTGVYSILFTEFAETSLLKMVNQPLVDVAVFSLTDNIPDSEDKYFDGWHIASLVEQSTLVELSVALAPWLRLIEPLENSEESALSHTEEVRLDIDDNIDESQNNESCGGIITELIDLLAEEENEGAFDFSQYLHNQGSVESALFMLDEYTEDNHQQLNILVDALKAKDFEIAKKSVINLQLNAKILAASVLEQLCSQWSMLLSGNDIPSSLKEVNLLLKQTREELTAIDSYAESI
jgi:hypothetical protein